MFLFFFNYLKTETRKNSKKITQMYHLMADVVVMFRENFYTKFNN